MTRSARSRRTGPGGALVVGLVAVAVAFGACAGDDPSPPTGVDPPATEPPVSEGTATGSAVTGSSVTEPSVTEPSVTEPSVTEPSVTGPSATEPSATEPAPGRIVALGEEFVLADLLALGIRPVASTATVPGAGFQGMGELDAEGIEILPATELNLEQLAALEPDVVVTTQFVVDEVGEDLLSALAELVVVPDAATTIEQVELLADAFGVPERAAELIDELDTARAAAADTVEDSGCALTLATVYPGPSVAAWVEGSTPIPGAFVNAGCELVPGPDAGEPDRNGRLFLSMEQLDLLAGERLVLLQSGAVEGESEALAALRDDPLWQQVPAVAADRVTVLDRLGYPGIDGQTRLLTALADGL